MRKMKTKQKLFLGFFLVSPILTLIPMLFGENLLSLIVASVLIIINWVLIKEIPNDRSNKNYIPELIRISILSIFFIIQFFNWIDYRPTGISIIYIEIFVAILFTWFSINTIIKIVNKNRIEWEQIFAFIPVLLVAFPLILLLNYWGSQLIWILTGFYLFFYFLSAIFKLEDYKVRLWDEKLDIIYIYGAYLIISFLIGLISTIIQYWGIVFQLIFAGIFVLLVIRISVYFFKKNKSKKLAEIKKIEKNKKIEIERKKEEETNIERRKTLEKAKEDRKNRQNNFLQNMQKSDSIDWGIVYLTFSEDEITIDFFKKKPIFLTSSTEKKKIVFEPAIVGLMIESLSNLYIKTMDDKQIRTIIYPFVSNLFDNINGFKTHEGYSSLKKIIDSIHPDLKKFL